MMGSIDKTNEHSKPDSSLMADKHNRPVASVGEAGKKQSFVDSSLKVARNSRPVTTEQDSMSVMETTTTLKKSADTSLKVARNSLPVTSAENSEFKIVCTSNE